MCIVNVHFAVAATRRDETIDTLVVEVPFVHALPGCLAFQPFADSTDPGTIVALHEWQSAGHFAASTASPGLAEILATLELMMLHPSTSRRIEVRLDDAMA
jgi:quinol monooxygenase YgiN